MAMVGRVGAGMEVVDGMQAKGVDRMSGDSGASSPDHTAEQVRSSG